MSEPTVNSTSEAPVIKVYRDALIIMRNGGPGEKRDWVIPINKLTKGKG
jgi:hypothetical protein